MSQLKRLTNPYRAVFRSYRLRPLFWVLAAVYLVYPIERFIPLFVDQPFHSTFSVVRDLVFYLSEPLYQLVLPIVFAVACMAHLRQQLAGPARLLIPNYRQPHLRVAAFVFFVAAAVLPFTPVCAEVVYRSFLKWRYPEVFFPPIAFGQWMGRYVSALLITVTLMTVAAWFASFITSWIAVVLAPIIFIAMVATRLNPWSMFERLFDDFYHLMSGSMVAVSIGYLILAICLPMLAAVLTILFNLFALSALWRRMQRIAAARIVDELPTSRNLTADSPAASLRRETFTTRWSRIRHLRSAGITLAAPWLLALMLAIILTLIPSLLAISSHPEIQMQISLILITILPSVAVALLWAERWPRLDVESLLPATRHQFVIDIIAAIAIDLLHFWIAITIAALLPLLLVPQMPLHGTTLAAQLLASILMQALAFASILWAMWFRSWPTLTILLSLTIAATAWPLSSSSSRPMQAIPLSTLIPISLAIGLLGLTLSATAYHRWLRGNWV